MDLPPSKLSNAASRLWGERTGQFQKKTDVKIDLGFHQTISTNGGGEEKASTSTISDGFVFGSRMSERVTNRSDSSTVSECIKGSDGKPMDVSSIFKRIAEKSTTSADTSNMWRSTFSSSFSNGSGGIAGEKAKNGPFGESTKELTAKCGRPSASSTDSPETDLQKIKTGEENELNLLHISCRFYQYNGDAKTWQERGMGSLRINQRVDARDDVRLVGRQSGIQRVLINSKVFPEMVLEELSEKRLKISARVDESELPQLFLIQASPGSIANLYAMLQNYIDACSVAKATQQLQIRKRCFEKTVEGEEDEVAFEEGTKKFAPEGETAAKDEEGKEEKRKGEEGQAEEQQRHPKIKKKRSIDGEEAAAEEQRNRQ